MNFLHDSIEKITNGMTREEVVGLIGVPSSRNTIGTTETWIYIYTKIRKDAFFTDKITDQKVLKITINDGFVNKKEHFDTNNIQNIAFSKVKTPIEGDDLRISKELFSNIGRFNVRRTTAN